MHMMHIFIQTTCQLAYIVDNEIDHNKGGGIAESLPAQNDDFQPPVDEQATSLKTDNVASLPVPVVGEDSASLTEAELQTDRIVASR